MELMLNILILTCALAGGGTAFFGKTLLDDETLPVLRRATKAGWVAAGAMLLGFGLGVWKEVLANHAAKEAATATAAAIAQQHRLEAENARQVIESLLHVEEETERIQKDVQELRKLAEKEPSMKNLAEKAVESGEKSIALNLEERQRLIEELKSDHREELHQAPGWLQIALNEEGQAEVPGPDSNPRIVDYLKATDLPQGMWNDETPWTSSFLSWCLLKANMTSPRTANPAQWLSWGVRLQQPRTGCVAVMAQPSMGTMPARAHFYIGETGDSVFFFGGNLGNKVSFGVTPKSQVIEYRWPSDADASAGTDGKTP